MNEIEYFVSASYPGPTKPDFDAQLRKMGKGNYVGDGYNCVTGEVDHGWLFPSKPEAEKLAERLRYYSWLRSVNVFEDNWLQVA